MARQGTIGEYTGRVVDLLAYHGAALVGDILLDNTFTIDAEGGRVTTGVQKLAQAFVVELFRERNSTPFLPDRGTTFLTEARFGEFQTQRDVISAFARAVSQIRVLFQSLERDTDPDDERFVNAQVLNVEILPGRVIMRVLLVTRAGRNRSFIFPIAVANVPAGN